LISFSNFGHSVVAFNSSRTFNDFLKSVKALDFVLISFLLFLKALSISSISFSTLPNSAFEFPSCFNSETLPFAFLISFSKKLVSTDSLFASISISVE